MLVREQVSQILRIKMIESGNGVDVRNVECFYHRTGWMVLWFIMIGNIRRPGTLLGGREGRGLG